MKFANVFEKERTALIPAIWFVILVLVRLALCWDLCALAIVEKRSFVSSVLKPSLLAVRRAARFVAKLLVVRCIAVSALATWDRAESVLIRRSRAVSVERTIMCCVLVVLVKALCHCRHPVLCHFLRVEAFVGVLCAAKAAIRARRYVILVLVSRVSLLLAPHARAAACSSLPNSAAALELCRSAERCMMSFCRVVIGASSCATKVRVFVL